MSIKISTGGWAAWLCAGSFKGVFENGVLAIFSGAQVADADAVETGDLLALVTKDGGDFTGGVATNGLNFQDTTDRTIQKVSADVWLGDFLDDGTMGWFRYYANDYTSGASTTAIRFDGKVGTSRADIEVVTTLASIGGSANFNDYKLNFTIL